MPKPKERSSINVQSERVVLAAVRLPDSAYDRTNPFGELRALAEQAGSIVVGELTQNLDRPVSGSFMGTGKIQELKALAEELRADAVIFDHDLSPKQIANIEEVVGKKVIDRSELILDIFAGRASTNEAKLQVELAQLEYTYPRLRAMWDHLERIVGVGGIGGVGTRGPGEQQLEIDRRLVQARRDDLTKQLREIQARKRREVFARRQEHFTVGLVGYTNAGKSTLFNALTAGGAYADDRLFATLMTRTREWVIEGAMKAMLSDTVGFVRELPHNLIASFKATLEEATHADVLLIVLDVSDPAADMQYRTVNDTLDELFKEVASSRYDEDQGWKPPERVLLLNKADRLKDNSELLVWQQKVPGSIPVCALLPASGRVEDMLGRAAVLERVKALMQGEVKELVITVPLSQGRAIHFLETHSKVIERTYEGQEVAIRTLIGARQAERLKASGAKVRIAGEKPAVRRGWSVER
jgi:GTP-binding protein HflX